MWPILICSVGALAIIVERLWTLQQKNVVPSDLTEKVWRWVRNNQLDDRHIKALNESSPLGQILASGLAYRERDREVIKEAVEDTGRHVVHELERYINSLGTIAMSR